MSGTDAVAPIAPPQLCAWARKGTRLSAITGTTFHHRFLHTACITRFLV
jgi:hypothetical protein